MWGWQSKDTSILAHSHSMLSDQLAPPSEKLMRTECCKKSPLPMQPV